MGKPLKTENIHLAEARARLLAAALPHVAFDGWGGKTFDQAVVESALDPGLARQACPRGALDLALTFHRAGDNQMLADFTKADLTDLRYRDQITLLIRLRLEACARDKEAVRRAVSFFALPQYTPEGSAAIWHTADQIWNALGDRSRDINWYSKRATLSAVYSASLLFWLGDTSENSENTWAFLDRRIEDVMSFEGFKAKLRENPLVKSFMNGPGRILDGIKAPENKARRDLPGFISDEG